MMELKMQTDNKKHSNYYAMGLLLVSLTITPFSLKAIGFSPNLSAGVDAWRQIASVFGESHQPATSAELMALNDLNTAQPNDAQPEPSLYAEVHPVEPAIAVESTVLVVAPQIQPSETPRRRCPNAASHRASAMEVNAGVTIENQVSDVLALRMKDIKVADLVKQSAHLDQERSKKFEQQIAPCRIELGNVLKALPVKDVRAVLRFRQVAVPFSGSNVVFDFQVPMPDMKRRLRASHVPAHMPISSIPEDAEL
jgi:hypothetical protein